MSDCTHVWRQVPQLTFIQNRCSWVFLNHFQHSVCKLSLWCRSPIARWNCISIDWNACKHISKRCAAGFTDCTHANPTYTCMLGTFERKVCAVGHVGVPASVRLLKLAYFTYEVIRPPWSMQSSCAVPCCAWVSELRQVMTSSGVQAYLASKL